MVLLVSVLLTNFIIPSGFFMSILNNNNNDKYQTLFSSYS